MTKNRWTARFAKMTKNPRDSIMTNNATSTKSNHNSRLPDYPGYVFFLLPDYIENKIEIMSKYSKALLENKNACYNYEIIGITKSNKIGRSLDGPEVMRSRLFWIRLPNGKNWIF